MRYRAILFERCVNRIKNILFKYTLNNLNEETCKRRRCNKSGSLNCQAYNKKKCKIKNQIKMVNISKLTKEISFPQQPNFLSKIKHFFFQLIYKIIY